MKIIFNDATELTVQSAAIQPEGSLLIRTISATREELKRIFQDSLATRKMIVKEREQTLATYEAYENLYSLTEYTGGIMGVAEVQNAAILVAQFQAQNLDDTQALRAQAIFPAWSGDSVAYSEDYKVQHDGVLYKCAQAHTSQSDWTPGTAPSLWTAIADPSSTGTEDNPIAVPETVTSAGMEYQKGKYYSWNDKVYLMNRQGMADGDSVILYFSPADLVGQYFEEVS